MDETNEYEERVDFKKTMIDNAIFFTFASILSMGLFLTIRYIATLQQELQPIALISLMLIFPNLLRQLPDFRMVLYLETKRIKK